jgi:pyrroline-5-carboxylate reductase
MGAESVGFVGGGRVARIVLEGWSRAGAMPAHVVVSDPNADVLAGLVARFPRIETCVGDNCAAAGQKIVFIGLHPAAFGEALADVGAALRRDAAVVSLAPKITIERLAGMLGGFVRIARAIPNAPSIVGSGFNPVSFGPGLPDADRQAILELFAPLGDAPIVDEATLEAYAVTAAMGPTYLWFQLYGLRELARSFGLSGEAAATAVDRMTRGALDTMAGSRLTPEEVMDLVPVHPLGEDEPAIGDAYRTRLTAVMERIRPA